MNRSFLLAAALAVPFAAAPARAAETAEARARASVVAPMTITNTGGLSFGSFGAGASGGTVVVDPDSGTRSVTGGVVPLGGDVSAASFTGYTSGSKHVRVVLPKGTTTLVRAGGTETMSLGEFTVDGKKNQKFLVDRIFTFQIGGTLQVAPNQADGLYEGSFAVTAEYQ